MKDTNDVGRQANALRFVDNLKSDNQLRTKWSALIASINQALKNAGESGPKHDKVYKEAIQAADNFLADRGYNTTAEAVLALLKSPFYEEHLKASEPNKASDGFVQKLLTDPALFKAWGGLLTQVSSGAKDIASLNAFLKQHGYDCTYVQVSASFVKMRNHQLSYWSGTYNIAMQELVKGQPSGKAIAGPSLVIYGAKQVYLAGTETSDTISSKMTYNNGKLSWKKDLLGTYSGEIVFSEITTPSKEHPYKGPFFTGTFSKPSDGGFDPFGNGGPKKATKYQISGELTPNPRNAGNIPAGVHPSELQKIIKWVNYILIGLIILKFIVSMGKKYKNTKDFNKASDDVYTNELQEAEAKADDLGAEISADETSPFEDFDFANSNVQQDIRDQIAADEAAGEKESAEAAKQDLDEQIRAEEDYDELPGEEADIEGGGWGEDLEEVFTHIR